MAPDFSRDEMKEVFKQALKEWMDEKFKIFGYWSAMTIGAAALCALVYFIFWVEGAKGGHLP